MAVPSSILIKRKRDETAPDTLILQPSYKRPHTDAYAAESQEQVQYVRQVKEPSESGRPMEGVVEDLSADGGAEGQQRKPAGTGSESERRVFHLQKSRNGAGVSRRQTGSGAKGDSEAARLAVFEEPRTAPAVPRARDAMQDEMNEYVALPVLKRPGKGSAVKGRLETIARVAPEPTTEQQDRMMLSLAHDLEEHSLAHDITVSRPPTVAVPKYNGRRRNLAAATSPTAIPTLTPSAPEEDTMELDVVYETYVLAPNTTTISSSNNPPSSFNPARREVGYLIIADEDQAIWEQFIAENDQQASSDAECDTDDADSNAENYYGADYPEDELASDDEFNRNAYEFRAGAGSDGEEWDEETGAWSGGEEEEGLGEYERMMNPWKMSEVWRRGRVKEEPAEDEDKDVEA